VGIDKTTRHSISAAPGVRSLKAFPLPALWHLKTMQLESVPGFEQRLRIPSEPAPPPIQEPLDPPENPDVPVREPDPDDPGQI
jgi:hypothetical protein